jgi:hypothetical protein
MSHVLIEKKEGEQHFHDRRGEEMRCNGNEMKWR